MLQQRQSEQGLNKRGDQEQVEINEETTPR